MPTTSRAAVCRTVSEPLQVEEIVVADPGPDQVLVDIVACAICHSDLSYIDGDWTPTLPAVFGHEAAGVVLAVGADVTTASVGDHVVVSLVGSCGTCRPCERGDHVGCETDLWADGTPLSTDDDDMGHGLGTATFADVALIHQSQVVPIPTDMPFDQASLLACGVLTGSGAVFNSADVQSGDTVAIIGCGGVGLGTLQAARIRDAAAIIAIDPLEEKRQAALSLGATAAIDPTDGDPAEALRAVNDGRLPDVVFVTTGAPRAVAGALDLVGSPGALVIVAMPPEDFEFPLNPTNLAAASQRIIGVKMGDAQLQRDVPRLVEHWRTGELDLAAMVSHTLELEQINEGLDLVRSGAAVRAVINLGASS